ncbi:hypothetical protein OpiT1DRAFT_00673 [Opitutaceae bacterium TAV1]|nr:hypothetical protein OpiT1DRAFT_00673 [Opitutaceae bacterium TAV1]
MTGNLAYRGLPGSAERQFTAKPANDNNERITVVEQKRRQAVTFLAKNRQLGEVHPACLARIFPCS